MKRGWFVALTALMAVVLVEVALHAVRSAFVDPAAPREDPRVRSAAYGGADWTRDLYREYETLRFRHQPYVGARREPFEGRFFRIGEDGRRHTWSPAALPDTAQQIHVYGGSTVWGNGVRDDHTLPSELARILHERGVVARVTNEGEGAWTFSQSLVQLTLQLRDGLRPDLVVFYDGVNDVISAHFSGRAGGSNVYLQIEGVIERERELAGRGALGRVAAWIDTHSMISRALRERSLRTPRGRGQFLFGEATHVVQGENVPAEELARDVVETYRGGLRVLAALSREFGFAYQAFWQPCLHTETRVREGERRWTDASSHLIETYRHADRLARDLDPHFRNVSDALADREAAVYIDFCHVSEAANRSLAIRIADELTAGQRLR